MTLHQQLALTPPQATYQIFVGNLLFSKKVFYVLGIHKKLSLPSRQSQDNNEAGRRDASLLGQGSRLLLPEVGVCQVLAQLRVSWYSQISVSVCLCTTS